MSSNADLDAWRVQWQAGADAPAVADLRDHVARETRRRTAALIAPILVTLVIGGWTIARAIAAPDFDNVLLAAETWTFIAIIWAGSLWIDRGNWRPVANTTAAFVEISIRRCRSTVRGLWFGGILYVAQLSFILFWELRYTAIELPDLLASWPVILIGWIGGPMLFAFIVARGRAKNAELEYLLTLRDEP